MPTITRQVAPRAVSRNGDPDSILNRVISVDQMRLVPLNVVIFGLNRTGKTSLACEFPKPLLLVSFEPAKSGGAETVRNVKGVSYVRVVPDGSESLKKQRLNDPLITMVQCLTLLQEIQDGKSNFATVVADGATSLQDVVLANLLDLPNVPDQRGWGSVPDGFYINRSEQTREVLRRFLDLETNVVILAKEKDHNPPREEKLTKSGKTAPDMRPRHLRGLHEGSYIATELGGATDGWLRDSTDAICRLFVEEEVVEKKITLSNQGKPSTTIERRATGKYIRCLRVGPAGHPNFGVGIRSCLPPEQVPEIIEHPTYTKLVKVIRG